VPRAPPRATSAPCARRDRSMTSACIGSSTTATAARAWS
jgi:hypothetical protein